MGHAMKDRPRRRKPEFTAPAQTADEPPMRTREPFAIRPPRPRTERTLADAAPLPNPRHELFAQQIAAGVDRANAYDAAGYDSANSYAGGSQLLSRMDIAARITTLQGKAAERAVVTVETLVDELEEARILAKTESQPAAMVAATKEKAVLLGLRIEKRDITARNGDPKGMTDDELALIARGGGERATQTEEDTEQSRPVVH